MSSKNKHYKPSPQLFAAGLALNDNNIEFIGNKADQTVVWIRNGSANAFKNLPGHIFKKLKEAYEADLEASKIFSIFFPNIIDTTRKVELYTYYVYGDLNNTPDVIDGELQPSENFREKDDCISLKFTNKCIDFKGTPLHTRYIKMIDAWSKGRLDKNIATDILAVSHSTYDFHKSKLFKILEVQSKPEAVAVAYKHHILCAE